MKTSAGTLDRERRDDSDRAGTASRARTVDPLLLTAGVLDALKHPQMFPDDDVAGIGDGAVPPQPAWDNSLLERPAP
jgi:hypothetical protein